MSVYVFVQLQQQQSRLMKINHDLRHKISVVEAQGKALIEQKVELEAGAQARAQEVGALRQEVGRLRERLQGDLPAQNPEEPPPQPPSPAEVRQRAKPFACELHVRLLSEFLKWKLVLLSCKF